MPEKLKHLSKYIRIELFPLELEEFNGDKEAYFLYQVQNELSDKHIVQYGKDRKTLVIYEKDTVYAQWQGRIPHSFGRFLRNEAKSETVCLHLPKTFLLTREKQHIIVKIKKVSPIINQETLQYLYEHPKTLARWSNELSQWEIYEYSQWQLVGLRYRSEIA